MPGLNPTDQTDASASAHVGQNIATSAAPATFTSAPALHGVEVCAPAANSAPIYVGLANTVAVGTGIEIPAGQSKFFRVANANMIWVVSAAAQNARALAT